MQRPNIHNANNHRHIVDEFWKGKECKGESFIIPSKLFEITQLFISIEIACQIMKLNLNFFEEISQIHQR